MPGWADDTEPAVTNPSSTAPCVVLVVPNGSHRPEALARAIAEHHPGWELGAVWAGDPQLRPALDGLAWWPEPPLPALEHLLASSTADVAEWRLALVVTADLLGRGASAVVVLRVGAVAVAGPIDALIPPPGTSATFIPRCHAVLPSDGLSPTSADLIAAGGCSANVACFAPGADGLVGWLADSITASPTQVDAPLGIGALFDQASGLFSARRCPDPAIGASRWRWATDTPYLLELDGYDSAQPWVIDPTVETPARVQLVGELGRQAVLADVAHQTSGRRHPLSAPGGIGFDPTIRALVAGSPTALAPWSRPREFREWLSPRYWSALHARRGDLATAFPQPETVDAPRFERWCHRAALVDAVSLLIDVPDRPMHRLDVATQRSPDGVNLVGYLTRESSLGDVARRLFDALHQASVPVSTIAHQRTASPMLATPFVTDERVAFTTTLAVVNADQFPTLQLDHSELLAASDRTIGYWFWELEQIPRNMRDAAAMVDEVWAGSRFVTDAFAAVLDCPVRHVPIPVPEPVSSGRRRDSFTPLAHVGDRFVFAVVFDHFSVTERKNPVAAIEAFTRAFAPDEGPLLVVKSMNAQRRWPQHQQVMAAIGDRPDIVSWDEHLDRPDHMAFIASVDALVSLHRSEGLGLHLAEAMWLGTPVIATRYSGNLDFMDDACSLLIDATMVQVSRGEGVYPPDAYWAEPDIAQAAEAMRRLVSDRPYGAQLATAARAAMTSQPTLAATGERIAALLDIAHPSSGARPLLD